MWMSYTSSSSKSWSTSSTDLSFPVYLSSTVAALTRLITSSPTYSNPLASHSTNCHCSSIFLEGTSLSLYCFIGAKSVFSWAMVSLSLDRPSTCTLFTSSYFCFIAICDASPFACPIHFISYTPVNMMFYIRHRQTDIHIIMYVHLYPQPCIYSHTYLVVSKLL